MFPEQTVDGVICSIRVRWPPNVIISLEIEDFDMEPEKDFVLIRDGGEPDSPELMKLTGRMGDNKQFVVSTGNR